MDLNDVKLEARRLSPVAHLATIGADVEPDVVPVSPAWEDDTLWIMTGKNSVKVSNIRHNTNVALHWQVSESGDGDGVEIWGRATIHDDLGTKRRLWDGMFGYDLNAFAPGGPDGSPDIVFIAVIPERAVRLKAYGAKGHDVWTAGD